MKALTLWQPWADLVIRGFKPYEFRTWQAPRSIVGQRIVIHAAKRPLDLLELDALLDDPDRLRGSVGADPAQLDGARAYLRALRDSPATVRWSVGLGTVRLGVPQLATDLFFGVMDADDIDPDKWAWPMEEPEAWDSPVPAKGAQGFWRWGPPARADLFGGVS